MSSHYEKYEDLGFLALGYFEFPLSIDSWDQEAYESLRLITWLLDFALVVAWNL